LWRGWSRNKKGLPIKLGGLRGGYGRVRERLLDQLRGTDLLGDLDFSKGDLKVRW
jgi:hypothetical protein